MKLPVYALSDSSGPPEPLDVVTEPDGRIVSETIVPTNPGHPKKGIGIGLVGFDAQGTFDPSFGFGGTLDLEERAEPVGSQLIAEPDGSILAVHPRGSTRPTNNPPVIVPGLIEFERLTATGRFESSFAAPPGKATRVPFGGGNGEPLPARGYSYPEVSFAVSQNSFLDNESLPRAYLLAGGRVLLAGDVSLTARQPGRRPERSTNRIALVLLDPSFELDPSAGAPGAAPVVSLSAPPQAARRDLARRALRVRLDTSAPGLAAIDVRVGRRELARRVVALLDTGGSLVNLPLEKRARRFLAAHRRARLQVTVVLHDLLADGVSARGTLALH